MDGFESVNNLDDLFPDDGSRWTNLQQVNPNNGDNAISISENIFSEGSKALRILSKPGDAILSKIDIEKGGLFAPVGSTLTIEADFYIASNENLQDLFLIDLECCSCWDESVDNNQCPGIRLKLGGPENYLSIERGKILGNTLNQAELPFPKNEWVHVDWSMQLSQNNDGENYLSINGQELINEKENNMPNAEEFRNEFAMHGIDFNLKEPFSYERIQIGATANLTAHEVEMYVDNFKLTIE